MINKTVSLLPGLDSKDSLSVLLSKYNNLSLGIDELAEMHGMEPPEGRDSKTIANFLKAFIQSQRGISKTVGEVFYAGKTASPQGALKLDGSLYSRDQYEVLYQLAVDEDLIIPETEWQKQFINNSGTVGYYSDGDGTTTFRLPTYSEEDRNWLLALDMYVQTEGVGGGGVGGTGYELCEIYNFRHPVLKPGFMPAYGGIITDCHKRFPRAWAFLQKEENKILCITEEKWQEMNTTIWHTNADGTEVGWNGIGGVPYFVLDLENKTLRLPDLRGMYAEAAGFDSLGVGGVHGDGSREWEGSIAWSASTGLMHSTSIPTGIFYKGGTFNVALTGGGSGGSTGLKVKASRVVPIANQNQPRAYGVLVCIYLGREVK